MKALKRFFRRHAILRKAVVVFIGGGLVLAGAFMIALPGPAILVLPAGLAILATEFRWARALLRRLKEKVQRTRKRL